MPNDDIESAMIYRIPDDPERNCPRCYQHEDGICHQYDLPVKTGVRCGLFAQKMGRFQLTLL